MTHSNDEATAELEAPRRRWSNRPLAREQDEQRIRRLWRRSLAILVAFIPLCVWVQQQNECLTLVYGLSELRAEREALAEQGRLLRLERARAESLPEIERWAALERGLVQPDPERVVVLRAPRRNSDDWVARAAEAPGRRER